MKVNLEVFSQQFENQCFSFVQIRGKFDCYVCVHFVTSQGAYVTRHKEEIKAELFSRPNINVGQNIVLSFAQFGTLWFFFIS